MSLKNNNSAFQIILILLVVAFVGMFNETSLNVGISILIKDFDISASYAQWVTTGYLLILAVFVPISSLLMQWINTRRLFFYSVVISIIGLLIQGFSLNFEFLLIGRMIQAIGTAIILPLTFSVILSIIDEEKRGSIMGLLGLVLVMAPAIAPAVSGIIIDTLSWHWIMFISIPIFLLCLVTGFKLLPDVGYITKPKINFISIFLSFIAFSFTILGLNLIGDETLKYHFLYGFIVFAIGIISMYRFTIIQLKAESPILNLYAFKSSAFSIGSILIYVAMILTLMVVVILPIYMINVLDFSSFESGMTLLLGGLIQGFVSPVVGKLFDQYGAKYLIYLGITFQIIALTGFLFLSNTTSVILIITLHSLLMLGISFVWMPAQTRGLNDLPEKLYSDGSAIMNTITQLGGALGTSISVTLLTFVPGDNILSIKVVFSFALVIVLISLLLVIRNNKYHTDITYIK
ncbi:DHA2 family efflux MFS transporter permease subunit [Staphylococcus sp. EG-SA-13]|nr:DHA2 family efflux MFS transporter permease subunit [Staphylococcus sp. EG-SA-13]